jgi:hypothetical protein
MPIYSSEGNYKTEHNLAQQSDECGGKLCLCMPPEGKMCDVWFVPHSCCLLSLTFLKHVPAQKTQKSKYHFHRLIHVQTCLIVTTTSVSTPPHPPQNTHYSNIISPWPWQTAFPLPSSSFRTNNPLRPRRQHSPSRRRKCVCCNRPNYPTHAVLTSSLHQETNGAP